MIDVTNVVRVSLRTHVSFGDIPREKLRQMISTRWNSVRDVFYANGTPTQEKSVRIMLAGGYDAIAKRVEVVFQRIRSIGIDPDEVLEYSLDMRPLSAARCTPLLIELAKDDLQKKARHLVAMVIRRLSIRMLMPLSAQRTIHRAITELENSNWIRCENTTKVIGACHSCLLLLSSSLSPLQSKQREELKRQLLELVNGPNLEESGGCPSVREA